MAKQERAGRTRRALLTAAAEEFDRLGYAGASLAGIARAAGISLGALTFHFASKEDLATAVREQGDAATRALVAGTATSKEPPLQYVASLTLALVELLENNVSVRAAARLAREASGVRHDWQSLWAPLISKRLQEPVSAGPWPETDPTALTALAVHLVSGVEATMRHRCCPDVHDSNAVMLARIWRQILPQLPDPGAGSDTAEPSASRPGPP
ncbi:TetR/AcrR family transcriptional regulator [Streptomyces sp. SA15]|uniref:TetR family transcriptional regulator n=1 Tax=Streptomyces sp. SA15 TaxID=934019 RepID=UPI0015C9FF49|nr:TetR/AcrR family transcriptional regulator [Streptomyces sp. SA15]